MEIPRNIFGLTVLLATYGSPLRAQDAELKPTPEPRQEKHAASEAEPKKKADAPSSPDVTESPLADDFLIIPLRVHILRSEKLQEVDCQLTDDDIRRIIGKVNKVWSKAGIHFGLESIRRESAAEEEKFRSRRDAGKSLPLNLFTILIPDASRKFEGQHVYYIHKFSVNGVFLGNKTSFVQETARLRKVPGGIDEPIPRVTAHELGHALSLPHRQNETNLLASGTTGTLLNEAEVKKVRAAALNLPGTLKFSTLKAKAGESADNASVEDNEKAARVKAWVESVQSLAKSKN